MMWLKVKARIKSCLPIIHTNWTEADFVRSKSHSSFASLCCDYVIAIWIAIYKWHFLMSYREVYIYYIYYIYICIFSFAFALALLCINIRIYFPCMRNVFCNAKSDIHTAIWHSTRKSVLTWSQVAFALDKWLHLLLLLLAR